MAEELKELRITRGQIKGSCTRAVKYLQGLDLSKVDRFMLKGRREGLAARLSEFERVQSRIEILDASEEQGTEREAFETAYYELVGKFDRLLAACDQGGSGSAPRLANSDNGSAPVKLPKIDLPVFSGEYEGWYSFYDTFRTLIHENTALKPIQRFQYLKSALKGDAAKVVEALEISEANYAEAWALLKARYDNKRLIVNTHLKAIMDLPSMARENKTMLRHLLDGALKHTRALKSMGRPVGQWDDWLVHVITGKLDHFTAKEWEKSLVQAALPTFAQLTEFLTHRCQILETLSHGQTPLASYQNKTLPRTGTTSHVVAGASVCWVCKGGHYIHQCEAFREMPVFQRIKRVKAFNLCLNCMRSTAHQASACISSGCRTCGGKHNTMLHVNRESPASHSRSDAERSDRGEKRELEKTVSNTSQGTRPDRGTQILLSTALVTVFDAQGGATTARALLDSGSQSCFATEHLINRLGLKTRDQPTPIAGINQTMSLATRSAIVKFKSRFNQFNREVECVVLRDITQNLPRVSINRNAFHIPGNIRLADPQFCESSRVDLLLGAEVFAEMQCVGQLKPSRSHPWLQKTHLGWVVSGAMNVGGISSGATMSHLSIRDLNLSLAKFWEVDRCEGNAAYSKEERECEDSFRHTHNRNADGRFVVQLPCRANVLERLGDNKRIAIKRFYNLERKLDRQPSVKGEYIRFMREYLELGHMKLVVGEEPNAVTGTCYLPHHAVFKEDSVTTKLRVVFDASCKGENGISLNDALKVGATIQQDVFSIAARFRTFAVVITADVEKMYRQVLVDPSHTPLQRIVWRDNVAEEVKDYELLTVTYGTAPASFLATRCLHELASIYQDSLPMGAAVVARDFYMDDLLTGADTLAEVREIRGQVTRILCSAGFRLRKWASNTPAALTDIPADELQMPIVNFDKNQDLKTLGIQWDNRGDELRYQVPTSAAGRVTKRTILSTVARIFDPLGLLGPVVTTAKVIVQRLWQHGSDWDESVPMEIHARWTNFRAQLPQLNMVRVSRRAVIEGARRVEMHGFSDASEDAYGACVYLVSTDANGHRCGRLLCARSRVAPLKSMTMPRLELCGATLLAKLISKLTGILTIEVGEVYCWTDATIVLAWIRSPSRNWTTFVANRIGEIQEALPAARWGHVPTAENPADIISRGVMPSELPNLRLWWEGPSELFNRSRAAAIEMPTLELDKLPERRVGGVCHAAVIGKARNLFYEWLFNKYSSYDRLSRVVAYCRRFAYNARKARGERLPNHLSVRELKGAKLQLAKCCQAESFGELIGELRFGKGVGRSRLASLSPFLDPEGVVRVGGRLRSAALPYETRHPILLPKSHELTERIIEYEHRRNLHVGNQATLAAVRLAYWPLSGREAVKRVVGRCVTCFRSAPRPANYIMGDLPACRVNQARPFAKTGVDYAGPLLIKEGKRRNAHLRKTYVAIFVCMAVKAVHIELVGDLTTESFLGALKRFMSRRGKPSAIYSDNGSNFVGANRELRELTGAVFSNKGGRKIQGALSSEEVEWHFIPPQAPHFGGLWEAAVKSAKHLLRKVAGDASLTFEELYTLLVRIEAVLNSRPLIPLSSDPSDLSYLTPSHFLIGSSLLATPEPDLTEVPGNRLSRWQHTEQLRQHFWKRWQKEYLHQLTQRPKWTGGAAPEWKPGTMVLVREDQLPPLQWAVGRIESVSPGADGVVRAATVRTPKGTFLRPVVKLYALPIDQ